MTGAGLYPAGLGYAGIDAVPPTPEAPGPSAGVAWIDQNGDYQVNGTGDLVKTTPTRQRALNLLRMVKASCVTDPKLGLYSPTAIDASWETRMRQSVQAALMPMVTDRTIRVNRIDIKRPLHFRASITVTYTVLATGETEIAAI